MAKNNLFEHLKSNLRNADRDIPNMSTLALGFTKKQIAKLDMKHPRLIWYDMFTRKFYDQGDSTKKSKSDWHKINSTNFDKSKPLTDLSYYIPINNQIMTEAENQNK